jgi:hypothetical protein
MIVALYIAELVPSESGSYSSGLENKGKTMVETERQSTEACGSLPAGCARKESR